MNDQQSSPTPPAVTETLAPNSGTKPGFRWYVINAYSGQEMRAKEALEDQISRKGMQDYFGRIFIPKTTVEQVLKSGKKKKIEKTSYPGYILVEMLFDEKSMNLIKNTPKISGFVGDQRHPKPISDREVLRLTSPEVAQVQNEVQNRITFEKGESVKIIDGAFTNFDGVVDEVKPDRMKLRILVSIFGRETPVELDYSQVKKLR